MSAFVPATPLPRRLSRPRRARVQASSLSRDGEPSPMSLDTLSGFESFCLRAQDWLCTAAADADGLGTFQAVPSSASFTHSPVPPPRARHRVMRGGRFFDTAVVAVWTSRHPTAASSRYRRRITTQLDRRTSTIEYAKDAVGVSVKLSPRNPAAPALRADAHYFQIGGGQVSWWFSGTADISMGPAADPAHFEDSVAPFLETWEKLQSRHRAPRGQVAREFLDDCLRCSDDVAGNVGGVERVDRTAAFGFITEVVDALLPAYLPLISAGGSRTRKKYGSDMLHDWEPVWGRVPKSGIDTASGFFGSEEVDKFSISGGATCESVTVRGSPLGSWRFSLAPSLLTSAGKTYVTLRNDHRSTSGPLIHI